MDGKILERLSRVTEEEQTILDGSGVIDRALYMEGKDNTINAQKLLAAGKLITMRPHTRFIHFPEHRHDYVEAVYMCTGESTHVVNGSTVKLRQGDLLFMNQSATHEILPTGMEDLAVNFIILPDFFTSVLSLLDEEETPLRRFLVDCLCGQAGDTGFLHFRSSGIHSIGNLVENLLLTLLEGCQNRRKMSQMTMALLFMELMAHTEALDTPDRDQATVFRVLSYIETHYAAGSLTELASLLHYDLYSLSREIKRQTGKTYTQLVQEKRLAQAVFLLKNTDRTVDQIAGAVGYENMGYFHRIFKEAFGVSPRNYRLQIR